MKTNTYMKDTISTIFAMTILVVFVGAIIHLYSYYLNITGVVESKDYSSTDIVYNEFQPIFTMNPQTGELKFDGLLTDINYYQYRDKNYHYLDYYIVIKDINDKHKKLSVSKTQWDKINVGDSVVNGKIKIK
jgi:hypothetical protein